MYIRDAREKYTMHDPKNFDNFGKLSETITGVNSTSYFSYHERALDHARDSCLRLLSL